MSRFCRHPHESEEAPSQAHIPPPGCEQCDGPLGQRSVVPSGGAFRVVAPETSDGWGGGIVPDGPVFEGFGLREAVGFLELSCNDEDAPACVYVVDHDAPGGEFGLRHVGAEGP